MSAKCYARFGDIVIKVYDRDRDLQCIATDAAGSKVVERWRTKHDFWRDQCKNLIVDTAADAGIKVPAAEIDFIFF